MSTLAVTGATGHLGRLAAESLIARGVPAGSIVAVVRSPEKAQDLADRGVQVRKGDYTDPQGLAAAFAGVSRLLLVSGSEVGQRLPQHRNVVEAAVSAGIGFIAYTGILNTDTTKMLLAEEHRATEEVIRASGLPYALLRNGWYLENYTDRLQTVLEHGLLGSGGDGRIAAASRADYAAAAAAVLASDDTSNHVYELGGDTPFTLTELAAEIAAQSGKPVAYQNLPVDEYAKVLVSVGLPEAYANILADSDLGIERGDLTTDSGDLHRLIGRPTTTLADAVAAGLKANAA
jgi:NAD(P)H dehydrogenase (quinone)